MNSLFLNPTPVDVHYLDGICLGVKREDMCLHGDPRAPRLAKLRGVYEHLRKLRPERVAVCDTRISHAGWGVSYLCRILDIPCYCFYPRLKGKTESHQQLMSEDLGAKLMPLKAGRLGMVYNRAKAKAKELGAYMLPLGLTVPETLHAHAEIAKDLWGYETVVMSIGSGMIAGGVLLGFPRTVIGISPGMTPAKQRARIAARYEEMRIFGMEADGMLLRLRIIVDPRGYYEPEELVQAPFPCSKWYDLKAWAWLADHIRELKQPVLFYNIGA